MTSVFIFAGQTALSVSFKHPGDIGILVKDSRIHGALSKVE